MGSCLLPAYADCPIAEQMVATSDDFENGLPPGWEAPAGSGGAGWTVTNEGFGMFVNPGSGGWLVINDEAGDKAGVASLMTTKEDFSALSAYLSVNFDLNFQSYTGKGMLTVEMLQGGQWYEIMRITEDYIGHVAIDLVADQREEVQFRFVYDDGGVWNWGAGIDNFEILVMPELKGNGICDLGETPENCPGDCLGERPPGSYWIAEGTDVSGNQVSYNPFNGGTKCDDCSEAIELGFEFNFYGATHETIFINSNGNLTFDEAFYAFTPEPFCMAGPKMIAPYFSDVDLDKGGEVSWYLDPDKHYLIVNWKAVAYYGCEGDCELRNSFQVIITDGSILNVASHRMPIGATVLINYGDMQWNAGIASGSVFGLGGAAATAGLNRGDGITCHDYGTFNHEGFDYYGNTQDNACPPSGLSHLDFRCLTFEGMTGLMAELGDTTSQNNAPPVTLVSYTQEDSFYIERVGPNPFRNSFVLVLFAPKEAFVEYILTDMAGRTLKQGTQIVFPGSNTLPFSLPDLARGTYVLSMLAEGKRSFRYVVKQ